MTSSFLVFLVSADDVIVATFPVSACQRVSGADVTVARAVANESERKGYTFILLMLTNIC